MCTPSVRAHSQSQIYAITALRAPRALCPPHSCFPYTPHQPCKDWAAHNAVDIHTQRSSPTSHKHAPYTCTHTRTHTHAHTQHMHAPHLSCAGSTTPNTDRILVTYAVQRSSSSGCTPRLASCTAASAAAAVAQRFLLASQPSLTTMQVGDPLARLSCCTKSVFWVSFAPSVSSMARSQEQAAQGDVWEEHWA